MNLAVKWATVRRSVNVAGPVFTARAYLANLVRPSTRRSDRAFDRAWGTETSVAIEDLATLGVASEHLDDANGYHGVHVGVATHAIEQLPIDPASAEFWDLGSGKGRAVLLAAEAGFARSVGVELATPLHEAALDNAARYAAKTPGHRPIDFINEPATDVTWPDGPLVVFLFNPFEGQTLERVAASLADRIDASPEPVYLIYVCPKNRSVFDRSPAFEVHRDLAVNPAHLSSVIYRGVAGRRDIDLTTGGRRAAAGKGRGAKVAAGQLR